MLLDVSDGHNLGKLIAELTAYRCKYLYIYREEVKVMRKSKLSKKAFLKNGPK